MRFRKMLFLRWLFIFSLTMVAGGIIYRLGLFNKMYEYDSSRITLITLAVFVLMTLRCGAQTWKFEKMLETSGSHDSRKSLAKAARLQTNHIAYAADLCEFLGFFGTIVGFVMMLGGFINFQPGPDGAVMLLKKFGYGMATAWITTLVGAACAQILKLQNHNIDSAIDRAEL